MSEAIPPLLLTPAPPRQSTRRFWGRHYSQGTRQRLATVFLIAINLDPMWCFRIPTSGSQLVLQFLRSR